MCVGFQTLSRIPVASGYSTIELPCSDKILQKQFTWMLYTCMSHLMVHIQKFPHAIFSRMEVNPQKPKNLLILHTEHTANSYMYVHVHI